MNRFMILALAAFGLSFSQAATKSSAKPLVQIIEIETVVGLQKTSSIVKHDGKSITFEMNAAGREPVKKAIDEKTFDLFVEQFNKLPLQDESAECARNHIRIQAKNLKGVSSAKAGCLRIAKPGSDTVFDEFAILLQAAAM